MIAFPTQINGDAWSLILRQGVERESYVLDYEPDDTDQSDLSCVEFGVDRAYFSGIDWLTHEYSDARYFAALFVDVPRHEFSVNVCTAADNVPAGVFRIPIGRFVAKDLLVRTITDSRFVRATEMFLLDPENTAVADAYKQVVSDFLVEFDLYVAKSPDEIDDFCYDIIASCADDSGWFEISDVVSAIMSLHGVEYDEEWLYLTFSAEDAEEFIRDEYADFFTEEDDRMSVIRVCSDFI